MWPKLINFLTDLIDLGELFLNFDSFPNGFSYLLFPIASASALASIDDLAWTLHIIIGLVIPFQLFIGEQLRLYQLLSAVFSHRVMR